MCSVLCLNHAALVQHKGTLNAMAEFSTWMIWFYVSDRTRFLPVEVKTYSRDVFLTVFAAVIAVGFGSFRNDKRAMTLCRQQSEEWKGWMQVCTPECIFTVCTFPDSFSDHLMAPAACPTFAYSSLVMCR